MFDSLALIVILSFFIPFISIRFAGGLIPSVAFEIIVGIIIGVNGFNIVNTNNQVMEFLSTFGLIYLMFLGGLESDFDFKGLKSRNFVFSPIFIAIIIFLLTLLFSYIFSSFLISTFHIANNAVYLTLIFSTTSVAIVFPTLKARPDIKRSYKQALTSSALIADFATLFFITAFALMKENKNNMADLIFMISIFVFAFVIKRLIHMASKAKFIAKTINMLRHKPHIQIGIRGSFALLFAFLFFAEKLGVEVILGSFIAGVLISKVNKMESEVMLLKLDAIGYGFFIPFFFIYQGAKSQLPIFSTKGILFALTIIVGSYLIKIFASLPLKLRFSTKETIAGGVLLSGRLSLIIAASIIGLKLGIINNEVNSAIILLAAFSCVLSPSLFSIIEKKKASFETPRVIIIGGGTVGEQIAKRLQEKLKPVILIEKDIQRCRELEKKCLVTIYCDNGLKQDIWKNINPTYKDTILAVTNSDETNLSIAKILQEKFGVHKIFARDNDPKDREVFKANGIVPLVYTETLIKTIETAIENPATFELLSESDKIIAEKTINKFSGRTIAQSGLSSLIEIILIKRDSDWLYPSENLVLKSGDVIVFIADKDKKQAMDKVIF